MKHSHTKFDRTAELLIILNSFAVVTWPSTP